MATVVSLNKEKIESLVASLEDIGMSQGDINTLLIGLQSNQQTQQDALVNFRDFVVPSFRAEMDANSNAVSELRDTTMPGLAHDLSQAEAQLADLQTVTIPSMQQSLSDTAQNQIDAPKMYVQDLEPLDPDDEGRSLVAGDTWSRIDENGKVVQKFWDGLAWVSIDVEVPDIQAAVLENLSPAHTLYKAPIANAVAVTNGANIDAA